MRFCSLPTLGMSVVLEPSRTIFHGPGNIEHKEGVELRFTNGFLEIDETKPKNVELIRQLMKHEVWGNPVCYVQSMIPVVVDGRKGQVWGPSLEEALAELENPGRSAEKSVQADTNTGKVVMAPDPEPPDPIKDAALPGVVTGPLSTMDMGAKGVSGKYRRAQEYQKPA